MSCVMWLICLSWRPSRYFQKRFGSCWLQFRSSKTLQKSLETLRFLYVLENDVFAHSSRSARSLTSFFVPILVLGKSFIAPRLLDAVLFGIR